MIDPTVFATYMTAISDRLKSPLADATHALYYVTLSAAMSTEQFEQAARRVFAEYSEFAFPSPAVFLSMLPTSTVDVDGILRQIDKLGEYNPNIGWMHPRIGTVRDALGEAVAAAYAAAGASACFSDNEVGQDIARRRFTEELAVQIKPGGSLLLGGLKTPLLTERASA